MIVEIACIVTDSELELLDDGIDIVVHQDADALERNGRLRPQDAHQVRVAPRDQRLRRRPRDRRARTLEYVKQPRARPRGRAAVRQQHRRRPAVPRPLHARARLVPALPQHRRVVVEGAVPPLVPGGLQQAAREDGAAPRPRRHPRVGRRAPLLPPADAHPCARPRRALEHGHEVGALNARYRSRSAPSSVTTERSRRRGPSARCASPCPRARRGPRRPRCRSARRSSVAQLGVVDAVGQPHRRELRAAGPPARRAGTRARAARPAADAPALAVAGPRRLEPFVEQHAQAGVQRVEHRDGRGVVIAARRARRSRR